MTAAIALNITADHLTKLADAQQSLDYYGDGHVTCPLCKKKKFVFKTAYGNARTGKKVSNGLKMCSEHPTTVCCPACMKQHLAGHAKPSAAPLPAARAKPVAKPAGAASVSSSSSASSSGSDSEGSSSSSLEQQANSQAAKVLEELETAAPSPVASPTKPNSAAALPKPKPPTAANPRCNRCWKNHRSCANAAYPNACEACVKANHPCDYDPANRPAPAPKKKRDAKRDASPKRSKKSKKSKKSSKKSGKSSKKMHRDGRYRTAESERLARESKWDGWNREQLRRLAMTSDDEDELFDGDKTCKASFAKDGCNECECLLSGLESAPKGHRYLRSAGGRVDRIKFDPDAEGQGLLTCRVYYAGKSVVVRLHPQHNARLCDLSPEFLNAKIAHTVGWLRTTGQYDGEQPDLADMREELADKKHYAIKDICVALGLARTPAQAKEEIVFEARRYVDLGDDGDEDMAVDDPALPW